MVFKTPSPKTIPSILSYPVILSSFYPVHPVSSCHPVKLLSRSSRLTPEEVRGMHCSHARGKRFCRGVIREDKGMQEGLVEKVPKVTEMANISR